MKVTFCPELKFQNKIDLKKKGFQLRSTGRTDFSHSNLDHGVRSYVALNCSFIPPKIKYLLLPIIGKVDCMKRTWNYQDGWNKKSEVGHRSRCSQGTRRLNFSSVASNTAMTEENKNGHVVIIFRELSDCFSTKCKTIQMFENVHHCKKCP